MTTSRNNTLARLALAAAAVVALTTMAAAQETPPTPPSAAPPVTAELLAAVTAAQPGQAFLLGVRLKLQPGWHIYGADPGPDGLPTTVELTLPAGFSAGPIAWPATRRFELAVAPGVPPIVSHGYADEVVLVQEVRVPPTAAVGSTAAIAAAVSWAACETSCVPGQAQLELALPIRAAAEVADAQRQLLAAWQAQAPTAAPAPPPATSPQPAAAPAVGLWLALAFAFLGGLILNLMPCVLPVLSIKILGFVKQAGEGRSAWRHGFAFAGGVLLSFWLLAGLLLLLRHGTAELGWGFHLQSPAFVTGLIFLLFVLGLSFFGVFEIGLSLTGVGQEAVRQAGLAGSFFSGVLATVVATPCTAPFMGTAVGYALAQPTWVALAVFTALAVGMALPYLLLSGFPALLRWVPKPGAWMEALKQFMGFLLMATVVWLLYVLDRQVGAKAAALVLLGLVTAAVGAWVYGRWAGLDRPPAHRRAAAGLAVLLATAGLALGLTGPALAKSTMVWQPYTADQVAAARQAGRPVFIDFTADWCLTCRANKFAFTSAVTRRFQERDVALFEADWTRRDPTLTAALESYGRSGVPLYVLYLPGQDAPVILPQLLTPGILLAALDKR